MRLAIGIYRVLSKDATYYLELGKLAEIRLGENVQTGGDSSRTISMASDTPHAQCEKPAAFASVFLSQLQ